MSTRLHGVIIQQITTKFSQPREPEISYCTCCFIYDLVWSVIIHRVVRICSLQLVVLASLKTSTEHKTSFVCFLSFIFSLKVSWFIWLVPKFLYNRYRIFCSAEFLFCSSYGEYVTVVEYFADLSTYTLFFFIWRWSPNFGLGLPPRNSPFHFGRIYK